MIDKELLEILACPICKKALTFGKRETQEELSCQNCRKAYPIKDGIPVMLPEEARDISKSDEGRGKKDERTIEN